MTMDRGEEEEEEEEASFLLLFTQTGKTTKQIKSVWFSRTKKNQSTLIMLDTVSHDDVRCERDSLPVIHCLFKKCRKNNQQINFNLGF